MVHRPPILANHRRSPPTSCSQGHFDFFTLMSLVKQQCGICLEDIETVADSALSLGVFKHKDHAAGYHEHCIKQWSIHEGESCPTCRSALRPRFNSFRNIIRVWLWPKMITKGLWQPKEAKIARKERRRAIKNAQRELYLQTRKAFTQAGRKQEAHEQAEAVSHFIVELYRRVEEGALPPHTTEKAIPSILLDPVQFVTCMAMLEDLVAEGMDYETLIAAMLAYFEDPIAVTTCIESAQEIIREGTSLDILIEAIESNFGQAS